MLSRKRGERGRGLLERLDFGRELRKKRKKPERKEERVLGEETLRREGFRFGELELLKESRQSCIQRNSTSIHYL